MASTSYRQPTVTLRAAWETPTPPSTWRLRRLARRQPSGDASPIPGNCADDRLAIGRTRPHRRRRSTRWSCKRPDGRRGIRRMLARCIAPDGRPAPSSQPPRPLGSVPGLKASRMTRRSPLWASRPVDGLMRTSRIPGGIRNGIAGRPAKARFMKSRKIGAATDDPVSPRPSVRGVSNPA